MPYRLITFSTASTCPTQSTNINNKYSKKILSVTWDQICWSSEVTEHRYSTALHNISMFISKLTSPQVIMTCAILDMRSAACCLTLADLLFNLHRIVPQIWGKYGFTRLPRALTTVPKPFNITMSCVKWSITKLRVSLKCYYDQILDIHFFTFSYTIGLS